MCCFTLCARYGWLCDLTNLCYPGDRRTQALEAVEEHREAEEHQAAEDEEDHLVEVELEEDEEALAVEVEAVRRTLAWTLVRRI